MAASQADAFAYLAGADRDEFVAQVDAYRGLYDKAVAEVQALRHPTPGEGALVQLYSNGRKGVRAPFWLYLGSLLLLKLYFIIVLVDA